MPSHPVRKTMTEPTPLQLLPAPPQPTNAEVLARVEQLQTTLDAILAKFNEIAGEIKPMIDTVSNHPMMRMLGVKK
jgi:hypothetical protein